MTDLKIYTLSINGLRSTEKVNNLKYFITSNSFDVLCLQETYVDTFTLCKSIEKGLNLENKILWSFGQSNRCGVAIILMNPDLKLYSYQTDLDGRFTCADCQLNDNYLSMCNINAPVSNKERNEYFENYALLCNFSQSITSWRL
jgi:exonuclease III